jgi:hypothetical protein
MSYITWYVQPQTGYYTGGSILTSWIIKQDISIDLEENTIMNMT